MKLKVVKVRYNILDPELTGDGTWKIKVFIGYIVEYWQFNFKKII